MIMDKHVPLCNMRVSEKYCLWIDNHLRSLIQTRDRFKKAAIKSMFVFIMETYRQTRNKVNNMKIQLKKQYYTNKISACKGNINESWRKINEFLSERLKSCSIDCR